MAQPMSEESLARETPEQRRRRGSTILRRLRTRYEPVCALRHDNPLQLLIATILSAQSTDEQVNKVTPALFEKYRTAEDFAAASQEELQQDIGSIGLFRNKARNIRGCAKKLVEEHGGEVPASMTQLVELPGVARKTANVVLGTAFGVAKGVVVDTHIQRVTYRLGLTAEEKNTHRIEQDLMAVFPRSRWIEAGHNIIWHGRKCCAARNPRCSDCVALDLCPRCGIEVSV